ncbi:MAG: transmembrane 220 family protein [Fidelibacterota bacterium]
MNRILKWAIALMFILFAMVNLNDADGFIWVPIYVAVAVLPLIQTVEQKYLNIFSLIIFGVGLLIALGFLNSFMPQQIDDRMVNIWEHQREGLGLILGSVWLWLGRRIH